MADAIDVTQQQPPLELLTQQQAAKEINVPVRFLQLDRSTKRRIPYVKIGRFVRYRRSDLLKFLDANVIGGGAV